MKLDLARTEIERWMETYCHNAAVHEQAGQQEQSSLCLKMAVQLNQVMRLLNALNDLEQEDESILHFICENMKADAIERLKLLDWPMLDTVIEAMETNQK